MTARNHRLPSKAALLATVRACAALSLLLIFYAELLSYCSETGAALPERSFVLYLFNVKDPLVTGGVFTAAIFGIKLFLFPYGYILIRRERRLAWGMATGFFVLLVSLYALAHPHYPPFVAFTKWPEMSRPERGIVWGAVAALQFALIALAAKGLRIGIEGKPEGKRRQWFPPVLYFLAVFLLSMIPALDANPAARGEASAVGSIRTIQRCADEYRARHPKRAYPNGIDELTADGCVDEALASGRRGRYLFTYSLQRADGSSVQGFSVSAAPEAGRCPELRSFYGDSSGKITYTWERRTAAAHDPELD